MSALQTITWPDGTRGSYTVSADTLCALSGRHKKRPGALLRDKRQFPKFVPGKTTAREYIEQYFALQRMPRDSPHAHFEQTNMSTGFGFQPLPAHAAPFLETLETPHDHDHDCP